MGRAKLDDSPVSFVGEDKSVVTVKPADTKRAWFLTVFEGAECFKRLDDTVNHLMDGTDEVYNWAYIFHDKDTMSKKAYEDLPKEILGDYELVEDENRNEQRWAYKRPHYHVLLSFGNGKSFNRLTHSTKSKIAFDGAKVMPCFSVGASFAYLTHKTRDAIRKGKFQYSDSEIVSNNLTFFQSQTVRTAVFDVFDPNMLNYYIFVEHCKNICDFTIRFGAVQINRYVSLIVQNCEMAKILNRDFGGRYFAVPSSTGMQFYSKNEVANCIEHIFC